MTPSSTSSTEAQLPEAQLPEAEGPAARGTSTPHGVPGTGAAATEPEAPEGPLLEIGTVVRPHGLRGECVVALSTNRLERVAPGSVLVALPSSADGARGARGAAARPGPATPAPGTTPDAPGARRELQILASRPHQGRYLVTFAGLSDRAAAESLRSTVLLARAIRDEPESWFVHELIGASLEDRDGRPIGTVVAVESNPASDLLVLEGGGLVPLRFVVERRDGVLVAELPEGLLA